MVFGFGPLNLLYFVLSSLFYLPVLNSLSKAGTFGNVTKLEEPSTKLEDQRPKTKNSKPETFMSLPIKPPYPPMEALLVNELPRGDSWQYEPKWDGFRCVAFRDGDEH